MALKGFRKSPRELLEVLERGGHGLSLEDYRALRRLPPKRASAVEAAWGKAEDETVVRCVAPSCRTLPLGGVALLRFLRSVGEGSRMRGAISPRGGDVRQDRGGRVEHRPSSLATANLPLPRRHLRQHHRGACPGSRALGRPPRRLSRPDAAAAPCAARLRPVAAQVARHPCPRPCRRAWHAGMAAGQDGRAEQRLLSRNRHRLPARHLSLHRLAIPAKRRRPSGALRRSPSAICRRRWPTPASTRTSRSSSGWSTNTRRPTASTAAAATAWRS